MKLFVPVTPLQFAAALALLSASRIAAQVPPSHVEAARVIDSLARDFVATHQSPSVAIAVVRGADTLALTAFGMADLENSVPATAIAAYEIGSVTKQFTAAIVMQLEGEGKLTLDDSIAMHVKGLPGAWRKVTIRQLLNHTSGIPDYTSLGAAWQRRWGEQMSPDTILALTFDQPMMFAPGTDWKYDNTGYVLLGVLIERVTGHSWQDEVRRRFIVPLRLADTHVCLNEPLIPHRVSGYEPAAAGWVNARYLAMTQPFAAGALCSSARDLVRWNLAFHGGRVVSHSAYQEMITPTGAAVLEHYGFGLVTATLAGHSAIRHGGGIPGFASANAWIPDAALSLTVFTNSGSAKPSDLLEKLARAALGVPFESAPEAQVLPAAERESVVGIYSIGLPGGMRNFTVASSDSGVTGQLAGQGANPMVYLGDHTFGMAFDPSLRIRFKVENGQAVGFTLEQQGATYQARRVAH